MINPIASARFRARRYAATAEYLRRGPGSVRCLGWRGHENLGDEIVFDAVQQHFAPTPVTWQPEPPPPRLASRIAAVEHRLTILGGGTILGGRYLDQFTGQPDPRRRVVFGSGVIDPVFPHSYRRGSEALDQWARALDGCRFVGVRGPRSAEILHQREVEAEVLGDPVAAFVSDTDGRELHPDPTIGINIGQSAGGMWGSELSMLAELAVLVRSLVSTGWRIEYHVVNPPDLAITRLFARDTGTSDSPIHVTLRDGEEFLRHMAGLHAFVGVKLHAVALAACAGVPAISIEYHPKCRDFMDSIGLGRFAFRSDQLRAAEVCDALETACSEPGHTTAALDALRGQRDRQRAVALQLLAER